jgi:hypothetical protein
MLYALLGILVGIGCAHFGVPLLIFFFIVLPIWVTITALDPLNLYAEVD